MNMKVDKFLCAHGKSISQPLQKGKERFHLQGIYQSKAIIQYEKKELPLHKTVIWGTIQHCIL